MPKRLQLSRAMMARTTGFDGDLRRRELREERHHILAPQLLPQNWRFGGVDPVKLENVLRRIHSNSANLVHGRSPLSEITNNDLILAHRCRRGPSTPTNTRAALKAGAPNGFSGSSVRPIVISFRSFIPASTRGSNGHQLMPAVRPMRHRDPCRGPSRCSIPAEAAWRLERADRLS